jgi:hypothetical protein
MPKVCPICKDKGEVKIKTEDGYEYFAECPVCAENNGC